MPFSDFFSNAISWQYWAPLAALLPALLVLLYFLKLKRQPLEVPSTYLWARTIEDLHVNTIWQRLRQSLLLLLQLILLALVLFSLLRPGWRGQELKGNRFIFLMDTSASMAATDVSPSRLGEAKKRVHQLIDQMQSGDVAMIISFSDAARVEQSYTDTRSRLHQAVDNIKQTERLSDLNEALRAASGLANPGRSSDPSAESVDVPFAEPKPATLYMLTDGGFPAVPSFSLGNLDPIYLPIGGDAPINVAVVAFSAERNPERLEQTQAFARLENFSAAAVDAEVELHVNGDLADAQRVSVPANGESGVQFDLQGIDAAALELVLNHRDDLPLDNRAYLAINTPHPARVLFVTPGNQALELALRTEAALKMAAVEMSDPSILASKETPPASLTDPQRKHETAAASGAYDLIIYDQCSPREMPQANTLFIGSTPPLANWKAGAKQNSVLVIDINRSHPLMQLITLDNVAIVEGFAVTPPPGGAPLIDSTVGSLAAIGPRLGFEDVVLGFDIYSKNDKGETLVNTDWPKRLSFPSFVQNALRYLGGARSAIAAPATQPGRPIRLRSESPAPVVFIQPPGTTLTERVDRQSQGFFVYSDTGRQGLYGIREKPSLTGDPTGRFAVNLFSSRESNLAVAPILQIEHTSVKGESRWEPARHELWKWLLVLGLGVLLFEWYVYNRRVYL